MKFLVYLLELGLLSLCVASPTQLQKRAISDKPAQGADCNSLFYPILLHAYMLTATTEGPPEFQFNDFQIEDAAQRGVDNRNGPHPGGYPHEYRNDEQFNFPNCPPGSGTLWEFPILKSGLVYGGGDPENYRVIYQLTGGNNGKYCGVIYHTNANPRGFAHCDDV